MADLYVIGHVNPDMDSIAAAMGYAWLLRERDGEETVAARAGAVNPQAERVGSAGGRAPVAMEFSSPGNAATGRTSAPRPAKHWDSRVDRSHA